MNLYKLPWSYFIAYFLEFQHVFLIIFLALMMAYTPGTL